VVKAISDLARAYGLEVVAEGIEDQEALAEWWSLGASTPRASTSAVRRSSNWLRRC
jgi:predicted signal transduction protein with EAL and GGDEF domain